FDFDHTLTDDSTEKLLSSFGIDTAIFWRETVGQMVTDGWDPALAWTSALCDLVGKNRPLGNLTEEQLSEFGKSIDFYPDVLSSLEDFRRIPDEFPELNTEVELYIISGGIEVLLRGTKAAEKVDEIRGCTFEVDSKGILKRPKRAITFTEKTRYLFEINKGLLRQSKSDPYAVNESIEREDRRVPFENMIYIGDGLTDVPAFSVVKQRGGAAFAVVDPCDVVRRRRAWEKLVSPTRVTNVFQPSYGPDAMLGAFLREGVRSMCRRMVGSG
ncbi:MAG: HAD family hydrolase, partial [Lacipirellulaceae bacterium]